MPSTSAITISTNSHSFQADSRQTTTLSGCLGLYQGAIQSEKDDHAMCQHRSEHSAPSSSTLSTISGRSFPLLHQEHSLERLDDLSQTPPRVFEGEVESPPPKLKDCNKRSDRSEENQRQQTFAVQRWLECKDDAWSPYHLGNSREAIGHIEKLLQEFCGLDT